MTNPEAGGRLGRYELLKKLGEGGMGAVWLARLTGAGGFQKLCLVKTVLPSIATDAQFLSRFHHEGRVLTQLQHSNIAQIYDMSEDGGTLFLAMEYVSGVDLARLVEQMQGLGQAIPVPLALFIAHELVEGLAFAHRKASHDGSPLRIVHRDVSPQNVMVSYEGEVKVIDFGIAKSEARSRHTTEATVMGKLGYLAPEQARGEAVDHRADQYACAIVLWELLANTPYLTRGTLTEMLVAMANPPPLKPLRPLRPEVPPLLEQEVLKALNPDRNQRFPTTDDFSRALMGVMLQMGTVPTHQQLGEFVRSRCLSDYQSQRLLMTNVETMRGPIPLTGGQRGASPEASDDALGRTHVRTGESSASSHSAEPAAVAPPGPASAPPPPAALAPAPAAAPPSLAPPPKPASAPRPFPNPLDDAPEMRDSAYTPGSTSSGSKAPLFIVLGLVLLLGAGGLAAGAWWLLFRDKGESTASALPSPAVIAVTPTPAATTPPPVAPGIPAATVGQPTPAPAPAAPEQPEQPEQRPGSAVPTASADPAPVAPPPGEAVPEGTRPPNAPPAHAASRACACPRPRRAAHP
jgi:serine/threonine protein kinase